jgi:TolB-like protein/DNA-binding winged helix-turn-helix (wHTH) protein
VTAGLYLAQPLSSLVQELNCPESAGRMATLMDQDQISFGPFRFDLGDSKLSFQGAPISLGSRALDILRVLALAKGNVVSKDRLLDTVWPGLAVEENNIQVHISALRKELDKRTDGESFIVTVPGRGYRLVGLERPPEPDQSGIRDTLRLVVPGASIAVLPFQNMSGDPEQEYFADGIVEDIITGLSRIKWLFVIARNSSFFHKGTALDLKHIGHDLGVRYLVEGSVRKAGDRVRITAQLIDAQTSGHLWAERYDRLLDDIFAVQDEITMSVIGAIEPNLRKVEIERVKRKRPDNLDAYDLVLRALPFVRTGMVQGADAAIPLLKRALELEPEYAWARALLAQCFHFRFSRGGLREADRVESTQYARAATAAGSDDATTLAIAAMVIWFDGHDVSTAFELFDRALAVSNSNVVALSNSAFVLAWMGNSEIAIERAQRAIKLSPFDTSNSYLALAVAYFHIKNHEKSREAAQRAVEANPTFSVPRVLHSAALMRLHRRSEAIAEAQRVRELDPTFTIRNWSVTVGIVPEIFSLFADALHDAGVPDE